ncbi:MAG: NAD-dependent epimerase/dehydratase family protein [Terracidiphilus sp.]
MGRRKIVINGAAGLVGQNLLLHLKERDAGEIVAIDKHPKNSAILRELHPEIRVLVEDMAEPGSWEQALEGCTHLVSSHAQIGGIHRAEFDRNNIVATRRLIEAAQRYGVGNIVNISSSVVNSKAVDDYTETKRAQEALIAACGIKQIVLRPTLMFGWFDRKHIGWLSRFMKRVPVFPVPGNGRHLRQPLYAGDFAAIVASAIEGEITGQYKITGQERIDYIDLMRMVKDAAGAHARIQKIPYWLFWLLLRANAVFDRNPPFTTKQLEALVTPDVFEVIDWPGIFSVRATPLKEALQTTFRHPVYSKVALEF